MYMLVCTVHHVHTLHLNLLLMEIPRVDEIHILLASMTISNCKKKSVLDRDLSFLGPVTYIFLQSVNYM